MKTIIYDGSIEGFLSVVHYCYYAKLIPLKIIKYTDKRSLLDENICIETDLLKAKKVLSAMKDRFPKKHFRKILHIFLCDESNFEIYLLEFIILGFKDSKNLENINYPSIYKIENLEKELFRLVHRMYGFIRFEELQDGTLYAKIETKYNILPIIGKHFYKRLNPYNLIIHDLKRELTYIKQNSDTNILKVVDFKIPLHSKDEEKFQDLWKVFFSHVSIKERKNLKLQKNFVPLIYRKHMLEFY